MGRLLHLPVFPFFSEHFHTTHSEPMFVFDLGCSVENVAWAPYSSTTFAAVTSAGYVCDAASWVDVASVVIVAVGVVIVAVGVVIVAAGVVAGVVIVVAGIFIVAAGVVNVAVGVVVAVAHSFEAQHLSRQNES